MSDTAIQRPFGVTLVGILVALAGILNLTFGILIVFSAFGDNCEKPAWIDAGLSH